MSTPATSEFTVDQIRELAALLEKDLLQIFQGFEMRTGIKIGAVELGRVATPMRESDLHVVSLRIAL